ncbi:thermonuclease family protein [Brucella sp. TWI432]
MLKVAVALLCLIAWPAVSADFKGKATVVDGDTIIIEGMKQRVRLYGIDAPEGKQPCLNELGDRYLCGSKAADALAEIIGRNGRAACEQLDTDRYGRAIAVCFVDGVDINQEMVRRGWAVEYTKYSDGRYSVNEQEARSSKRGLWSGEFQMPWDWRKQQRNPELQPAALTAPQTTSPIVKAARASCKAARSCKEAVIMWCNGYSQADRDGDGIPCENVCRTLDEVEQIKEEVDCGN